jgi:hypothetical protein
MSDLSFERDIFPLFRARDIEAMSFAFDLSSYEDVCDNAEEIHSRLPTARCRAMHPGPRRTSGGFVAGSTPAWRPEDAVATPALCTTPSGCRYSAGRDDGSLSAAALSLSSDVSQRFLMSREASGAASLPTPLNVTSSSTRTDVPLGDGVRV